ncbi:hypothetical protein G6F57_016258 [Rhizopus arrhizus]|nr:hypothetical protein G6F57_016258 [Rhizopus arrhizus]
MPPANSASSSANATQRPARELRGVARCLTSASGSRPSSAARIRDDSASPRAGVEALSKLGAVIVGRASSLSSAMRVPVSAGGVCSPPITPSHEGPNLLLLLPLYFLLAVGVSALLFFPALRQGAVRSLRACVQGVARGATRSASHAGGAVGGTAGAVRDGMSASLDWVGRYRWQVAIGLTVVLLPSLFAFLMRHNHTFVYSTQTAGPDRRIQALLEGERLAPPAALPPEAFTTREVELVRPKLGGASRNWDLFDADFRQRLLLAYRIMREQHGYEMALIEGYRSPERQEELAGMGTHARR